MMAADPLKNVRVVLCGTAHPGNVGAAARAMKTMGLAELYLVRPQRFPDPRAEWLASGAGDLLERARICADLDEALAGVALAVACSAREREVAVKMVTVREAAARVMEVARSQRAALVFGNETFGLTTAEVNKCRLLVAIPADPAYSSLNLAAAVQVCCYELRMAALASPVLPAKPRLLATHEQLERFYAQLEKSMVASGFLDPGHPRKLMPRLRRLFARAQLDQIEINILRGMVRTMSGVQPEGADGKQRRHRRRTGSRQ